MVWCKVVAVACSLSKAVCTLSLGVKDDAVTALAKLVVCPCAGDALGVHNTRGSMPYPASADECGLRVFVGNLWRGVRDAHHSSEKVGRARNSDKVGARADFVREF